MSQQPTANGAQGTTAQEHEDDRHCFFIDMNTLGQKSMDGFQKVEKIKAAPSDDLDFPKRSQIQGAILIHEWNFSSAEGEAFHGPERKTFDSSHLSIVQRIRSGFLISLS